MAEWRNCSCGMSHHVAHLQRCREVSHVAAGVFRPQEVPGPGRGAFFAPDLERPRWVCSCVYAAFILPSPACGLF